MNDTNISQKSSWKISNRVMNICRAPKVPPLLVNKRDSLMTSFHISVSLLLIVVYYLHLPSDKSIDNIVMQSDEIITHISYKFEPQ